MEADVGFSIHPGVISEPESVRILGALGDVGRTRAGARHLMALPAVAAVASDARLLQLAQAECLVGPGGVLRMRPLLVHASSKTLAPAPRRVLHIEYAASLQLGSNLELAVA